MDINNAIEVRNMTKYFKVEYDKAHTLKERLLSFGKSNREVHTVLKNINLDIKKGETVCLIGTNGSGKSTLLKLMTKIIYPNKGTIETQGKLTSLLELGAGFHQDFTGRENIYFNAAVFGLTKAEIEKRVDDIIEFSELGEFIDNPVRTYSSGMYMRLAFSIAINVDAEILLIDEILAVGDQHFQDKCFDKLKELALNYEYIPADSSSTSSLKVIDIKTGALVPRGRLKVEAIFANMWLKSAGVKMIPNEKRSGITYAFNENARWIYANICNELFRDCRDNGVIDTVKLFSNMSADSSYQYTPDIIVNLFRDIDQTYFINLLFLSTLNIGSASKNPVPLYTMEHAKELLKNMRR